MSLTRLLGYRVRLTKVLQKICHRGDQTLLHHGLPPRQGLYDPEFEKDSCGVGFVAQVNGTRSPSIVQQALSLLRNLEHRGAEGADCQSGDGAGILCQVPHQFFLSVTQPLGINLPPLGHYGVGMIFLPREDFERRSVRNIVKQTVKAQGLKFIGWRSVPVDGQIIGPLARASQPRIKQFFVSHPHGPGPLKDFERQLYLLRRKIEKQIEKAEFHPTQFQSAYIVSLSSQTIVYKGMLKPSQLESFFLDLQNPLFSSAMALVHSRFSTNTFPSWSLAQPFRTLCHNGEINTIRGNRRWMKAREDQFSASPLGSQLFETLPLVNAQESDSASLDKTLELLYQSGRDLAHSSLMLMPDPWEKRSDLSNSEFHFYRYHSMMMEPWDGPAAVCFSNGQQIGAKLDRNGLRPLRYIVTRDGRLILSSEAGALREASDASNQIVIKGRIGPGQILVVDTESKQILGDQQIRQQLSEKWPYDQWLENSALRLSDIPPASNGINSAESLPIDDLLHQQLAFGYTREEIQSVILPMAKEGKEVISSMGNDTPLAVFSDQPQLLFNYFRQLFAQVTNPPIDPIRESQVMSLTSWIGPLSPLLAAHPSEGPWRIESPSPVLTEVELENLIAWKNPRWQARRLSILYSANEKENVQQRNSLGQALKQLTRAVDQMLLEGASCIVLSDRQITANCLPIPSLLALSAVHQHLIRRHARSQVDIVIETGEARQVHHLACLLGYGASGIVPYLGYQTIRQELNSKSASAPEISKALSQYKKALETGLLKIFSKMGISTAESYKGGQIFEAIGISQKIIDSFFTGTISRIEGIGLTEIEQESRERHRQAFLSSSLSQQTLRLPVGSDIHYRPSGEQHSWKPKVIEDLQTAVRTTSKKAYQNFSAQLNEDSPTPRNLRNLFCFKFVPTPLPLEKVETAESIVKNFTTGAMSLGALSEEAHQTLAKAMNRLGAKSNSGEGGEDPIRYQGQKPDFDSLNSAIKQVASGRFGVTAAYLHSAKEIQIKMAQGAKPGEGGQLPGEKVDQTIARLRHSTPGVPLISPPPHHDIYSIEDLKQLIFDLRQLHPEAAISVKLVSQAGVGTVAAGVAKAHADKILISGDSGGTGAAPLSSIKYAGAPWEMGLSEAHQTLTLNGTRNRVRLETDGQLRTGRDVAIACLLGADEFGFSTAPLVTQGCLMMRKCHLNICPVGIATQDPVLRQRFKGSPEYLIRYFFYVAEELREIMAKMGFRTLKEMRGRMDRLDWNRNIDHPKIKTLNLSPLLHIAQPAHDFAKLAKSAHASSATSSSLRYHPLASIDPVLKSATQESYLGPRRQNRRKLDQRLIELTTQVLEHRQSIAIQLPIKNTDLSVGTRLSGHLLDKQGDSPLQEDSIRVHLNGSAGQSLGAFLISGVTLKVEGDTNDYAGKGLSGGKIIITPPLGSLFSPSQSIIVGNTTLYGATSGEFYAHGLAGDRFAVRNSGAHAVVEGVGEHGCEYMTGGVVVILGSVGRNFAAGMSGGQVYVWDHHQRLNENLNPEMVKVSKVDNSAEELTLRTMIEKHYLYTNSRRAFKILENWEENLTQFVVVKWEKADLLSSQSTTSLLSESTLPPSPFEYSLVAKTAVPGQLKIHAETPKEI